MSARCLQHANRTERAFVFLTRNTRSLTSTRALIFPFARKISARTGALCKCAPSLTRFGMTKLVREKAL
jgi:hypothetical protein